MKQISKVVKIGNSKGVTLKKNIAEVMKIEIGDNLEVTIKKIEEDKK
jgi:antitoxin component of MazEF toxin-antitoxin module